MNLCSFLVCKKMVYFCHQRTLRIAAILFCSHEKVLSFPNSHVCSSLSGSGLCFCNFGLGSFRGRSVQWQVSFLVICLWRQLVWGGQQEQQRACHPKATSRFPMLLLLPCPSVIVWAVALYRCHLWLLWPLPLVLAFPRLCCSLGSRLCSLSFLFIFIMLSAWWSLACLMQAHLKGTVTRQ